MEYANKSHNMLKRNLNINFDSYCITEKPGELSKEIEPIKPLLDDVKGWWNKLFLFSNTMPDGYILFLDVDTVIINDLTEVVEFGLNNLEEIACYSDAIEWEGSKFSSSMMIFRSGTLNHIYQNFVESYPKILNFRGGDQVWTFPQLNDILYLDEKFPKFKMSLKFQLATRKDKGLIIPSNLPNELKLIDFHGRPKPHEVIDKWPLIKKHWR